MRDTGIAYEAVTPLPFADAVARCRAELAAEGMGVLTEIDFAARMKEKLGVELAPSVILGACHPPSANRAVAAVPAVAVMLPCNVCVAVESRGTVVRAMNPEGAMHLLASPVLDEVAKDVGARVRRVVEKLEKG